MVIRFLSFQTLFWGGFGVFSWPAYGDENAERLLWSGDI
ncbi:hypothetical Protein YC6258_04084 [Gynuella sunshinyii YC6258]|uniref:Uncharacterized protein n=1 Tax=Gynuella sunshinyii YC6258 TaxID=1445510 RepID=A0A0C5V9T8_9GAMM|nr:hypothetical Protein YC6258_04084 [Gynuella sunshinyii YC6258]